MALEFVSFVTPTPSRPAVGARVWFAMRVQLVDHPMFATQVMNADPDLLDRLFDDYLGTIGAASPEMARFLFGHVPVEVFDRIFSGRDSDSRGGLMWLMHLSGYFGGRWLRGEIEQAQPDAMLNLVNIVPGEEKFQATMERAGTALTAADADDATVLAYAHASLLDTPAPDETGQPVPGLTDSFGYNLGYMLEILAAPPEGLVAGAKFQIQASGLFGCTYASARLAVLAELAEVQAGLAAGGPYSQVTAELLPVQEAAVPRGRSVWSSGLSVQGFPQSEYDQLLDVSSSFLETVQATALTMVQALGDRDAAKARRGAVANAAMIIWLASYMDGLLHGEGAKVLPTFA